MTTLAPSPTTKSFSPSAVTTVPSQQELDLLFGPLYDEFLNAGLQIHQSSRGIFINQAKYALEILRKHGMEKCDTVDTPMATKPKLDADLSGQPVDQTDYRSKIRSLMYLTSSRPDIVQADSGFELTAFLDADHAGCIDTRKSTSGGIQFLGDKLVSWMSKKQDCTVMSSAEAKYMALSASCRHLIQRVLETRKAVLQREQAMVYARVLAAGFETGHLEDLNDRFGSPRLRPTDCPSKGQYKPSAGNASVPAPVPESAPAAPQSYQYDSNYQPAPEKIAEAHKAARFAVGALAFDDVFVAVDYLKKSLELLTNPSASV
ncbi:retrovirus-related pol polyprotein from transposon TNT 1-94 [Tanacetum coccineum]|uniref:Retrovirus-related pol polyprotein from transposon TNT 1-94 n=1 Tax=Tanacetum coccineum TaxID=301880 RepID=A0ABQ5EHU6_9ASTR